MSSFLYRLGHLSVRRRGRVLLAWLALVVGLVLAAGAFGGETVDRAAIPGTESQRASDLLAERFPTQSGSDARVVFAAPDGSTFDDASLQAGVDATVSALAAAPGVSEVSPALAEGTVSPEGDIAFVTVRYDVAASDVTKVELDALTASAAPAEAAGVQVEFGGDVIEENGADHGRTSELIGMAVALVVLLISFGSLLAAGMPLVTALLGVFATMMGIQIMAGITATGSNASTVALMIGLAVGIDYALFIITRHRQNLADGFSPAESAARANATAGGAVVFAGLTVVIALCGLSVAGIPFLTTMGIAAALSVLFAVLIAITLTPALLGLAGGSIDRWRIGRVRTGSADEVAGSLSGRWARTVTRRPATALLAGLALMLLLAVPALDLRLGMLDAGSSAPSSTERRAYDLLADGFGPGFNGPLTAVVDLSGSADPDAAAAVTQAVAADPGVLAATTAATNPQGDTAIVTVIPRTGPASQATEQLVHHLRHDVIAPLETETGATVAITGTTAANIDISDKLATALPIFVAVVIGLTMLLLLAAFRSILVPIKAAVAILLSIASSFGVLVAVFQWGWMKDVIGLQETVPIMSFLPIMMFAILFGLSMDYEVFILSRIREDYVRTGEAKPSVVSGLTSSARVITAAALIMISVFGSFILGDDPVIKMFGLGFAVAVLLDATVVRMVLVPAAMTLLDRAAWWLPRWLDRALPDLDVEGEHLTDHLDHPQPETTSSVSV